MNFLILASLASLSLALPYNANPFEDALRKRQSTTSNTSLQVDLGYDIYEGTANTSNGINQWNGIRFAQAPIGSLRWQAPQPPAINRSTVIQATEIPSQCSQSLNQNNGVPIPASEEASETIGSEDCLFLTVTAPDNAQNLPVLVWIHGGGYGEGNGGQSLTEIITTNNNSFIGVTVQYRLGAFGFLSSDEVSRFGVANAGLRDQAFALQWVQSYIHLFGGNSSQVTISGESAGAGAVMLQTMTYGGTLGTSLFSNAMVASPYLPMQYSYNDYVPSQSYAAFAESVGCLSGYAAGSPAVSSSVFQCLVGKDTDTLQKANVAISSSGMYGTWAFVPVTDGVFIQDVPSRQLQQKKVNGLRILSGNNALEGPAFVAQNITTEEDLTAFIQKTFPLFTADDVAKVLHYYPGSNASDSTNALDYATLGYTGPNANNQSSVATGQQQRANNIYAETTFVCPSYWLAEAFTNSGKEAYKYQYSVPAALHGSDITGFFGPASVEQGETFTRAFMTIWGNFVTQNNPSISQELAIGDSTSASSSNTTGPSPITDWPVYTSANPYQINLNNTGGELFSSVGIDFEGENINVTQSMGPGLVNDFTLVNAVTWEGGRGIRCDFWRAMGVLVPE